MKMFSNYYNYASIVMTLNLMASGFFKIPVPQWAQSGLHIMQTYIWPILKKKR